MSAHDWWIVPLLFFWLLAACAGSSDSNSATVPSSEPTSTAAATPSAAPSTKPMAGDGEATDLEIPPTCQRGQEEVFSYVNYTAGYCLYYPASFHVGDVLPEGAPNVENILGIYGPAYDNSLEPLRAGMSIVVVGPAEGRTLQQVVGQAVVSAGSGAEVTTEQAELGGERAVVLEGVPGRTQNRKLLAIHEEEVYEVTVYPTGDDFPAVAGDVELVWQSVLDSFTFLSGDVLAQFAQCPEEASPYADVTAGYCLRYPSQFGLGQTTDPRVVTIVDTPMPVSEGQETVSARLTIKTADVAEDRTLEEVVDGIVANYPDIEIRQRPADLGGEAAIVVEGQPGSPGNRQLFVLHGDTLYRLTLFPPGDDFPEAGAATERLWEAVTDSFAFLP